MLRGNFGWNNFTQHLDATSHPGSRTISGAGIKLRQLRRRARASRPASPPRTSVFINANWQFNVNALYQGPWGIDLGANFFGREGFPNPYYVRTRARGRRRYEPSVPDPDRPGRHVPVRQRLRVRPAPGEDVQFRSGRRSPRRPSSSTWPTPRRSCSAVSESATTGPRPASSRQNDTFNQIFEVQSPRIVRLGIHGELLGSPRLSSGPVREFRAGPFVFCGRDEASATSPRRASPCSRSSRAAARAFRRRGVRGSARLREARRATSSSSRSTRCATTPSASTATPAARRRTSTGSPPEGRVFSQAHSHNVITLPSHTNILTGMLPYQHGVRENAGFRLSAKSRPRPRA